MKTIIEFIFDGLVSVFGFIIEGIFGGIGDLIKAPQPTKYAARFETPSSQFQREGGGFRIGYEWGNSLESSFQHLICLGGSGSRKSTVVGYSTILQSFECSNVIFNPSGEYFKTATFLKNAGHEIFELNYADITRSIGFNGFAKCKNDGDVYKVSKVIHKNNYQGSNYDYWAQSSENLVGFFGCLLKNFAPPEYSNLPNVLHMLEVFSYDSARIDKWVARNADERSISKYKSIIHVPEKTLLSTVATALNTLAIYGSPTIAAITAKDTLSFELFRQKKCSLFISGSPSTMRYSQAVSACFFDMFFSFILDKDPYDNDVLPIRFIIDECASVNLEGTLPKILELGRKFRISICTLWQAFEQAQHLYGKNEAANILANSKVKVFMPGGQPSDTCKMLSELLGRYSYVDDNEGERTRELLTPQEVFQLKKILVLNGNMPCLLEPKPYFESRKLCAYTELPLYQLPPSGLTASVPLLNFDA